MAIVCMYEAMTEQPVIFLRIIVHRKRVEDEFVVNIPVVEGRQRSKDRNDNEY